MQKSSAQRKAAELKVALVTPDTSPRGHNVEGESDSWDFGVGAGFYLNATEEKWKHWKMYDYIISELPQVLKSLNLLIEVDWCSIMGHSMGGHGALTLALKNPFKFRSVSAFAPICNPTRVPWGQKAFSGYLGDDNKESWKEYDATELALKFQGDNCPSVPILMDTGTNDEFLKTQLHPWAFEEAAKKTGKINLESRMQEGYDHSYFFIASFIEDHVQFHAFYLNQGFW
jgi:S-formylglutathione hydrolase